MKKLDSKGFLLTEALIVSTLLVTVMLVLFSQFKSINRKVNSSLNYDSVSALYKANEIKSFLEQENFVSYISKLEQDDYVDITGCYDYYFNSPDFCKSIVINSGVTRMIVTNENLYTLKQNKDFNDDFSDYIDSIKYNNSNGYKLIVSFNDGTFGNVKLFDDEKFETMIGSTCNIYNNRSYTINILDNNNTKVYEPIVNQVGCSTVIDVERKVNEYISSLTDEEQEHISNCYTTRSLSKDNLFVDYNEENNIVNLVLTKGVSSITFVHKSGDTVISTNSTQTFDYCTGTTPTVINAADYKKTIANYTYSSASMNQFSSNAGNITITLNYTRNS